MCDANSIPSTTGTPMTTVLDKASPIPSSTPS